MDPPHPCPVHCHSVCFSGIFWESQSLAAEATADDTGFVFSEVGCHSAIILNKCSKGLKKCFKGSC